MNALKCKTIRLFAVLGVALMLGGCHFNGITGSGNVTTQQRKLAGTFTAIDAGNGLEVVLEQSPDTEVTVMADDNLQEHISTKVNDGVLVISCDFNNFRNVKMKKVMVKMPIIEAISVKSGAQCEGKNTIRAQHLSVETSSGAEVDLNLETEKTVCESSSGSEINLRGKSIDLECASSSGSAINAEKLIANNIIAGASSGSNTKVHPLLNLNASASSGASVDYYHIPKNLNKKSGSGGSVNQQ